MHAAQILALLQPFHPHRCVFRFSLLPFCADLVPGLRLPDRILTALTPPARLEALGGLAPEGGLMRVAGAAQQSWNRDEQVRVKSDACSPWDITQITAGLGATNHRRAAVRQLPRVTYLFPNRRRAHAGEEVPFVAFAFSIELPLPLEFLLVHPLGLTGRARRS